MKINKPNSIDFFKLKRNICFADLGVKNNEEKVAKPLPIILILMFSETVQEHGYFGLTNA